MKHQIPTLALLAAFAMLLIAIVVLLLHGQDVNGLAGLGFGTALGTIIGTIGGISPPSPSPSQINNSPGAKVTTETPKEKPE